ncbi:MAG: aldo/keto reductase, partial [Phycisphaerae bacterium]
MNNNENRQVSRRDFMRRSAMVAAGLGSVFPGCKGKAEKQQKPTEPEASQAPQEEKYPQMPRRKLGKTGIDVPCLSFGTLRVDTDNQILLRKTLQSDIDYWDTAYSYSNGNGELGIGKFLSKNPDVRKKLFLVTKASGARKEPTPKAVVAAVEERLQTSLKRLNTNYIDLYYGVH